MAGVKISDLSSGDVLTGTELIPIVQGGGTKKVPVSYVNSLANSNSRIFGVYEISSGDTSILVDGLSVDSHYSYEYDLVVSKNTDSAIKIHINSDTTGTAYYSQNLLANGTSQSSTRVNDANIGYSSAADSGSPVHVSGRFTLNAGRFVAEGNAQAYDFPTVNQIHYVVAAVNSHGVLNNVNFLVDSGTYVGEGGRLVIYRGDV